MKLDENEVVSESRRKWRSVNVIKIGKKRGKSGKKSGKVVKNREKSEENQEKSQIE